MNSSVTLEQDRKLANEAYHEEAGLNSPLYFTAKVRLHVGSAFDISHSSSSSSYGIWKPKENRLN